MKAKHAIILLALGFCLDLVVVLLRTLHVRASGDISLLAALLKIGGGFLFIYKLVTYPKWKDFLNR
ncbi:MAG TPA: hypothetical protein VHK91_12860 [Flavisolibacter sp.]|jgi:hypothetical protein|nr:hypothetical protein [Flavisolibacter sp.]